MVSDAFHKPIKRPSSMFDVAFGSIDPAEHARVAHATASALLSRVRTEADPETVTKLVEFTAVHGIETIAELWSQSPARSLPGALWRIYLLQLMVHNDATMSALLYERGSAELSSADPVIAGAPTPAGPAELINLADTILRGVFDGDFASALERAASFCRVEAAGATHIADDYELTEPQRASELTTRALRLATYASDLSTTARLWRSGLLI